MNKKHLKFLVFAFFLVPLLGSAQAQLVSSGFNIAGGDVIDNQSFDYSIGELISNPIETSSVKGNIGILQVIADLSTSIENENLVNIIISPNPSQGLFEIKNIEEGIYTYSIYNTNGTLIEKERQLGYKHTIDLSRYNPGIYILNISTEKNLQNFKLIKT